MSTTAVRVQGLGKEYRIGKAHHPLPYNTLQATIVEKVAGMLRRKKRADDAQSGRVWALKGVDLTVEEGEVLGIIGRNGSGKSTLLKILSDIVEPTEGKAEIRGRVASLLEVGTGFHSELTGRENVYLNGAILGMNQQEVRRNFDQIVEFSGIGQYIDTPVKRYSSGMYLRLAFAVAAHLRPQVLIIDEVLAVGDYEFQQRCIGRMREVGKDGRTVLFVSHNMSAVESLCSRCVLIDGGHLTRDGVPYEITREYRRNQTHVEGNAVADLDRIDSPSRKVRILSNAHLVDEQGDVTTSIPVSRAFEIRIGVHICTDLSDLRFIVRIENPYGERMITIRSPLRESVYRDLQGNHEIACRINEFPLAPGIYRIGLAVFSRDQMVDEVNGALSITVTDANLFGEGRGAMAGICVARSEWAVDPRERGRESQVS